PAASCRMDSSTGPCDDRATRPVFLPRLIHRVAHVEDGGPVLSEHTGDARYARDAVGDVWIRKRDLENGYNVLLAEAIGWLLPQHRKVPVPGGAFHIAAPGVEAEGVCRSWLSRQVLDVGHWNRGYVNNVNNIGQLGRVLALDTLIFNEDRHSGNILL